jgi:hypothetical protein
MADIIVDRTNAIPTVSNTDSIYFTSGGVNVDTNLNHSALANGLTSVYVSDQWSANIGSPSTSLIADLDAVAGSVFSYKAAGGACWYSPAGGSSVCNKMVIVGYGTMTINGTGTVTNLEVSRGNCIVGGTVLATNVYIAGGLVDIQSTSGTAQTIIDITGGSLKTRRGCTTLTQYGGNVYIDSGTNTFTTIVKSGGTLNIAQSGAITTFRLLGGDAASITIARPITITNTEVWGNVLNLNSLLQNPLITFQNTPTKRHLGF